MLRCCDARRILREDHGNIPWRYTIFMEVSLVMGVPLFIIHFCVGMFLDKSHPAIGGAPYNVGDPMLRDFPIENGSVIDDSQVKMVIFHGYVGLQEGKLRFLDYED